MSQTFLDFLRSMDLRVFQERELGLDVYLSGLWGIIPVCLAVASATVFLLAIFQAIPLRRHSIPVLLGAGLLAAAIGLGGTYLQYKSQLRQDPPRPRILAEGKGGSPAEKPGQTEALLALPLLLGGTVLAGDLAGSLFLLIFWGKAAAKRKG